MAQRCLHGNRPDGVGCPDCAREAGHGLADRLAAHVHGGGTGMPEALQDIFNRAKQAPSRLIHGDAGVVGYFLGLEADLAKTRDWSRTLESILMDMRNILNGYQTTLEAIASGADDPVGLAQHALDTQGIPEESDSDDVNDGSVPHGPIVHGKPVADIVQAIQQAHEATAHSTLRFGLTSGDD